MPSLIERDIIWDWLHALTPYIFLLAENSWGFIVLFISIPFIRGTKKQPRKGNNKQGNPNFNKPGSGFDPMAFQNPNIYNAYYNTGGQNMGAFKNPLIYLLIVKY